MCVLSSGLPRAPCTAFWSVRWTPLTWSAKKVLKSQNHTKLNSGNLIFEIEVYWILFLIHRNIHNSSIDTSYFSCSHLLIGSQDEFPLISPIFYPKINYEMLTLSLFRLLFVSEGRKWFHWYIKYGRTLVSSFELDFFEFSLSFLISCWCANKSRLKSSQWWDCLREFDD